MKINLTKLINESLYKTSNKPVHEYTDLFMWEITPNELQEVNTVFVAQDQNRAKIKNDLQQALTQVEKEYRKIMSIFYYFDDKSLGTISEKVLTALFEKTEIFKAGSVSQTGGSGGLADITIAGQGISLKTTLIGSAINLGSAQGEGGVLGKDPTLPNSVIKDKKLRASRIPIKSLKTKYKSAWEAVDRKVKNISIKVGNDLFLWAAVSKDKKTKKLQGFTFYLLDIDGAKLYKDIMTKGFLELQSGGEGSSWNVYTSDGVMFTKGDTGSKYLNLAPSWVKAQFDEADADLSEASANIKTKDSVTPYSKSTKVSIKVDPAADKGKGFNFDEISKQVFNTMLSVLTEPKNMQKIVASIPA